MPNPLDKDHSGMEMGAMRMPFFPLPGSTNCILEYYLLYEAGLSNHGVQTSIFPNPGSAPGGTGIYVNGGLGPNSDYDKPRLILQPKDGPPDDPTIANLSTKVVRFISFFTETVSKLYTEESNAYEELWQRIVTNYEGMTFDDLVMEPAVLNYAIDDGNLGGVGLTEAEAQILYTIGTGDGSWGAFYPVSALWFLRCTMFGFGGSDLVTVMGLGGPTTLPHYDEKVKDSAGNKMTGPLYSGIQSLVEYLYYVKAPGAKSSLHEAEDARLFTRTPVDRVVKKEDGSIDIHSGEHEETYDFVFLTSPQWATQTSMRLEGFSQEELPSLKTNAQHTQHNISSCKLFFPLKEQYWTKKDNKIPQVLVTDTFLQDAYSLAWKGPDSDPGVILASYTWEDDSLKLLPFSEDELVEKVLGELSRITTETVGQDITQYIKKDSPVMIQWITQPGYSGCAKLYRQRDEEFNQVDLTYNQEYAGLSNLYFAGENYSVEGGWTEPALRSALDGVMRLLDREGAKFKVEDFEFDRDYPSWT